MSQLRVLSFRNYHGINEEEKAAPTTAANQILDLFFQAYTGLSTKIDNYNEETSDLIDIKESPVEKRGELMSNMITKVSRKVDKIYADAAFKMVDAGKELKNAYEALLQSEDGKKDIAGINTSIYAQIDKFVKTLSSTNRTSPDIKKTNESFGFLFEANLYPKVRTELKDKIVPVIARLQTVIANPPTEALKSQCQKGLDELTQLNTELATDDTWAKMKKSDRKKRLVAIRTRVDEITNQLLDYQVKTLATIGFDQKVSDMIKKAHDLIVAALEILSTKEAQDLKDVAAEDQEDSGGTDAEEGEEGGVEGDDEESGEAGEEDTEEGDTADLSSFKTIKSGTIDKKNLSKTGKNYKTIMEIQKRMNKILPKASQITADGMYGAGTEKAIVKISAIFANSAPALLGKLDGKSMTPGFQAFLVNRETNKSIIKPLMVYKGKSSSTSTVKGTYA